jgi:hypothetical protein
VRFLTDKITGTLPHFLLIRLAPRMSLALSGGRITRLEITYGKSLLPIYNFSRENIHLKGMMVS